MRGGMRKPNNLWTTIPVFVTVLCGQTPQPHAGWKLVPGGENLIVNGYWDSSQEGVQFTNGVVTAGNSDNYTGSTNLLAPRLYTKGDFGVVGTIRTAPGMSGLISLTGSLPTSTAWWQGVTTVEFGADGQCSSWDV